MARKQSRLENEKLKIPRTYWQGLRDCHKLREREGEGEGEGKEKVEDKVDEDATTDSNLMALNPALKGIAIMSSTDTTHTTSTTTHTTTTTTTQILCDSCNVL